ncbi:hypothetical protein ACHHYP_05197 [Achlya hypogyna]|uniref:Uncharacterized protein n=1 Tax=Achlya hypogyna TaxID=1202772 RepID=A0A1V9YYV5_ACHHY|nr:hypothetical protein ACHHYP_05197 [Achlya hypogyna]
MTSYAAWEKYDVDAAMQQIEEEEKKEVKKQEACAYEKKKGLVVDDAGDSAEVSATKAALAALKAKKAAARKPSATTFVQVPAPFDRVEELERQAALLQRKSLAIQTAMTARGKADALYSKSQYSLAIAEYETVVRSVDDLDALIPQLETSERALEAHATTCTEQHDCSCHHKPETSEPVIKPLPKSSDLKGISLMLRIDALLGLGKCELERCRYGAAADHFKHALLQDANHLEAWRLRGSAFLSMGANLLALLHFNKVVILERTDTGDGAKELADIEGELVRDGPTEDTVYIAARQYLKRPTHKETVERLVALRQEADVIMIEGFHVYANSKYQAIIDTLDELQWTHPALDELRQACHASIAGGLVEMKKDWAGAVRHCEAALRFAPQSASVTFRLGQCLRQVAQFDAAATTLQRALGFVDRWPSSVEAAAGRKLVLDEIERNAFDQSELDPKYIKLQGTT